MIDNCTESSRMMFALGAAFCLFGLRFMVLRWREFAITERRMSRARVEVEEALRTGVSALQPRDGSHGEAARLTEAHDARIAQASDPPRPSV